MFPPRHLFASLSVVITAVLLLSYPVRSMAADICPEKPINLMSPGKIPTPPKDQPTYINALEVESVTGVVSVFSGKVELERGNERLTADRLLYDSPTDTVEASGDVTLENAAGDRFQTPELQLQLETDIGFTAASTFTLGNSLGRGDAQRIEFKGRDHTRLTNLRFTTCAWGQDDWFLKLRELELDREKEIGTARHATISFLGAPIFYLPYLSFPISDQRKSGFLLPGIGHRGNVGTIVEAPYYMNLAPNYDNTITPRFLSKRGLQLQNEFRYLGRQSEGKIEFEVLPGDDEKGENRSAGTVIHRHAFSPLWSANVDLRGVSDKEYLEDFGDDLGVTSQTHLPQIAELIYRGPLWNFAARMTDYQTVDRNILPNERPYARLPQLTLLADSPLRSNRPRYQFEGEWVDFQRDDSVTGERLNLFPSVSLPLMNRYGFITPRIGSRHIQYNLSGTTDERPSLSRGLFSLDSGVIFERDTRWGARPYIQTLEPRLYYLYIPHQDQDNLPIFDTSVPDFTFTNLFRDNRFLGGDRIGDANQLTAAVTTRFLDDTDGHERLRASLGRIYYFDDRRVNIPAGTIATNASDLVGETTARLIGNWYVNSNVQWNKDLKRTEKSNIYLQYNPEQNKILNIGQRFIRDELHQRDVSLAWPIGSRWKVEARSLYSMRDDRNLESSVGLEYNACCWAIRILATRRFVDPNQINGISFQLALTGLGKHSERGDSPFKQSLFSFPEPPRR
jgi:LPS-assembly protein